MKTLYLPIHIPGMYHARSLANKHGLRDALAAYGDVTELDYAAVAQESLESVIRTGLDQHEPELLFTQFQGADASTVEMASRLQRDYPALTWANWNGDVYPEHLISPAMLDLLRHVDVQLVVNASVLSTYFDEGIHAAFCPFGVETAPEMGIDAPNYDVLFLGNNYSEARLRLYEALRALEYSVGIYGVGWPQAEGECNYDFAASAALYRKARIVISDNQFPEARGYLSDRPIQALAAGTLLFQQTVADLEPLTGLRNGSHYVEWHDLDELRGLLRDWLDVERIRSRQRIARDGQSFVNSQHTWARRVEQLLNEWLPEGSHTHAS